MNRLKAGVVGSTGYAGSEAIRILLGHPNIEIKSAVSRKNNGVSLDEIFADLTGYTELKFTEKLDSDLDVIFLCLPHGEAKKYIEANDLMSASCKIIDLSTDYRKLSDDSPFVYGLPEYNKEKIQSSNYIANPGCFATGIQLGLLPLAANSLLNSSIHITAMTGSTGAGTSLSQTSHFSWRNNNISVYKPFTHQHLEEINQSLSLLQKDFSATINWVPMRGNFTRGIFSSIYFETDLNQEKSTQVFTEFYKSQPFTHIVSKPVDLKQVVGTNQCLINVNKVGDQLHITTVIDNLVKGAAGQAIENMNLCFGLEQCAGLKLKPSVF